MTKRKPRIKHRVQVVMKAPRQPAALAIYAQVVHDLMTENAATFPAPDPPLSVLGDLIAALKHAAADALTKAGGTAQAQKDAADDVMDALRTERAYVEKVAAADPENAVVIAERAGMHIFSRSFRHKPPLELRYGRASASIHAIAKAIEKAVAYDWQVSKDGKVTWVDLDTTTRADKAIDNLEPGTIVHVRCRAMCRHSQVTDWCDPVWIIVV